MHCTQQPVDEMQGKTDRQENGYSNHRPDTGKLY